MSTVTTSPFGKLSDAVILGFLVVTGTANNSPSGACVYVQGSGEDYTPTNGITLNRNLTWRAYPNTTVIIR